jgi:hypothetical protein
MSDDFQTMPTIAELLRHLPDTGGSKEARWRRVLWRMIYASGAAVAVAAFYTLSRYSREYAAIVLIAGSIFIALFCWLLDFFSQLSRGLRIWMNPAGAVAEDIDVQHAQERALAARLSRVPEESVRESLSRLDSHLAALEKWIDIARIFWLFGPALVALVKFWPVPVSDSNQAYVQALAAAMVVGILLASLQLRFAIFRLSRVVTTLNIVIERSTGKSPLRRISRTRGETRVCTYAHGRAQARELYK